MQLTITSTASTATDLGFLLHKNPDAFFEKEMSFGRLRVYYPEARADRCTAALHVEIDPVGLVRGRGGAGMTTLAQYVSDRPYAASSFLSVALAEAFGTALGGRSKERPERVDEKMPLTATLSALGCDGGAPLIRRIFEPLGYAVVAERSSAWLDDRYPDWGPCDYYAVTLSGAQTVRDLLTHMYVLVPVLDNAKHYFVGDDEVDKLVRRGEGWLAAHPEKDLIASRYLRYRRSLANDALARLAEVEGVVEEDAAAVPEATPIDEAADAAEPDPLPPVRLNDTRIAAVLGVLKSIDPPVRRVIDLGCGEGRTLAAVLKDVRGLEFLAGMDVSSLALERAERRLKLDRMGERERARIGLFQGSLVYRDTRLAGFDAALLTEVLEHLDPDRLASLVRVVWEFARPGRVIVTTPNADYNTVWPALPADKFRHPDHRFEWTRAEFQAWAEGVSAAHGYSVTFGRVGDEDADGRGTPTQMAVFTRT